MSAILPRSAAPDASDAALSQRPDRSIDYLAAFFDDEAAARAALRELGAQPSMARARLELLGPADGSWQRFVRRIAAEPPPGGVPPWRRDAWLLALLGGLSGGVSASIALIFGYLGPEDLAKGLGLNVAAGLAGAAFGAALSQVTPYLPPYGAFEGVLRRRLASGQWAVRVGAIPWTGQAALLAWLEARALPWYGTSTRSARV